MQPKHFTKRELQLEKKFLDIAKETKRSGVVALRSFAILICTPSPEEKKERAEAPPFFFRGRGNYLP